MRLSIAVFVVGLTAAGVTAQTPGQVPLRQFTRVYQIVSGDSGDGIVRISSALGGTYAEWQIQFEDPEHELRMLVGFPDPDGSFPVWRFEQEPAPAVAQEGVARLEETELVAEFRKRSPGTEGVLLERWRLAGADLEFTLEAGLQGEPPQRIGGFVAARQ